MLSNRLNQDARVVELPQPTAVARPRVVLICHAGDLLNREGLARWLASFTDLVGVIELHEQTGRMWQRIRREVKRVGWLRFVDVLAFRLYARWFQQPHDHAWKTNLLSALERQYPALSTELPILKTSSPNSPEAESFLRTLAPTMMIARCKTLLKQRIYSIPTDGTYVMHPGICPQYRNAHGCFWAIAQDDLENVGMTLLRVDRGVDTGPIYGYFRSAVNPLAESHDVIQQRVVFDHLDAIRATLLDIAAGTAAPLSVVTHESREWGQPWLSAYLKAMRRERRRRTGRQSAVPQTV